MITISIITMANAKVNKIMIVSQTKHPGALVITYWVPKNVDGWPDEWPLKLSSLSHTPK